MCRVVQYTSNVTCYVIIITLVLMSLDRYLAIRKIGGSSIRNQKNTILTIKILWSCVLVLNIPHLLLWEEFTYYIGSDMRTVCIFKYHTIISNHSTSERDLAIAKFNVRIYFLVFILVGYVIPFISIFIIYGLIMLKLNESKGQQVNRGKRRVTFMVIAVIASFGLCWGPLQVLLFLQHIVQVEFDEIRITILVISNCIAYMNTCINPIIYGYANQDFRV
jgi:hypothetical protein